MGERGAHTAFLFTIVDDPFGGQCTWIHALYMESIIRSIFSRKLIEDRTNLTQYGLED